MRKIASSCGRVVADCHSLDFPSVYSEWIDAPPGRRRYTSLLLRHGHIVIVQTFEFVRQAVAIVHQDIRREQDPAGIVRSRSNAVDLIDDLV